MAIVGHKEMARQVRARGKLQRVISHQLSIPVGGGPSKPEEDGKDLIRFSSTPTDSSGSHDEQRFRDRIKRTFDNSIQFYVDFITKPLTAFLVCALWIGFLAFSAVGISNFEVNLTTQKLFSQDSPLVEVHIAHSLHSLALKSIISDRSNPRTPNRADILRGQRLRIGALTT